MSNMEDLIKIISYLKEYKEMIDANARNSIGVYIGTDKDYSKLKDVQQLINRLRYKDE